jgi:Flp pilus assembly pilin Flp
MLERVFTQGTEGQGLVEYGVLLAFVSLAAITGLIVLGNTVIDLFGTVPVPFID